MIAENDDIVVPESAQTTPRRIDLGQNKDLLFYLRAEQHWAQIAVFLVNKIATPLNNQNVVNVEFVKVLWCEEKFLTDQEALQEYPFRPWDWVPNDEKRVAGVKANRLFKTSKMLTAALKQAFSNRLNRAATSRKAAYQALDKARQELAFTTDRVAAAEEALLKANDAKNNSPKLDFDELFTANVKLEDLDKVDVSNLSNAKATRTDDLSELDVIPNSDE